MSGKASSSSRPGHGSGSSSSGGGWEPPLLEEMQALLPQYEFLSILGHGGMGAVYKAVQISLDRPVAIKVLPGDLMDDAEMDFAERFKNEARTMAKMNHPGIVNVFDFGEAPGGLLYIVMEFVDGTDVSKMILAQGKLPPEYALAILAHVCDALDYAHKHGIVHRDIKPANIMLNSQGLIKVADFGLAKANDASQSGGLTKSNVAMGTPDYVSPEALIAGIALDGRADIYAMGVMLYQMLTGTIPRGMWTMPSASVKTDPRFDAIIAKAMQTDRDARYPTALHMRQDLDVIITTPQATLAERAATAAQNRPTGGAPRQSSSTGSVTPQSKSKTRITGASGRASKGIAYEDEPPPKSNLGLIIGGIAVVLGIGAFVMFGGSKPKAEGGKSQTASASSSSGTSATSSSGGTSTSSSSTNGSNNSGTPKSSNGTVDLLALVDLKRDVQSGDWSRTNNGIAVSSGGTTATGMPRLQFEKELPEEYNVDAEFTPTSGDQSIVFNLWMVKKQARFTLNRTMNGRAWAGFERVSGKAVEQSNGATAARSQALPNGQRQRVHLEVRRNTMRGYLNDELIAQWNGDPGTLSLSIDEKLSDDGRIGIGAYQRGVTFHRVTMRPDSGNKPNDIFYFAGHRYQIYFSNETWASARDRANSMKGHLATIGSEAEDGFLNASYRYRVSKERDFVFIGGSTESSANWAWVNHDPFDYKPGDFKPQSGARMLSLEKRGSRLMWKDQASGARAVGFIVEWDSDGNPSPPAPVALTGAVDLLANADIAGDTVRGKWDKKKDGLAVEPSSGPAMFALRQIPPEAYDFEVEFTITTGNRDIAQILPLAGSSVLWKMGFGSGETTLFCFGPLLDGKSATDKARSDAIVKRPRLKANQRYRSLVEVRKGSLRALIDGEEVLQWKGDFRRLSSEGNFKLPDSAYLGLGAYQTGITFHKAELRPPGGSSSPAPAAASLGGLTAAKPSAAVSSTPSSTAPSAPPPQLSDPRIAKLQAGYEARFEADAQKPFAAAVAALNQSYVSSGIARARAAAQAKGASDEIKALDAEKAAIESGSGVPEEDAEGTPESLKTLRSTYRSVLAKHAAERDAKAGPLLDIYLKALDAYVVELTKAGKIDEAKQVQAFRDSKAR